MMAPRPVKCGRIQRDFRWMDEKTAETEGAGAEAPDTDEKQPVEKQPKEVGGRAGPEPTRYGDWELNGICVDF